MRGGRCVCGTRGSRRLRRSLHSLLRSPSNARLAPALTVQRGAHVCSSAGEGRGQGRRRGELQCEKVPRLKVPWRFGLCLFVCHVRRLCVFLSLS
eukprot:scaffold25018_cov99-Isochrysis_galbana.AAC.2